MYDLYQELIIDHGTSPRNFINLDNYDVMIESYNPLCGDRITLFLIIKNQKIIQAAFQGEGCAIATASASIMTEIIMEQTTAQALQMFTDFTNSVKIIKENAELDILLPEQLIALTRVKNYPSRIKCATLAWHALKSALNQHGSNL
jgi:nitrogen fixation protein NifU and related proteins